MIDFWKRVKYVMDKQRLTHANVEEAINVSLSQLSSWIANDRYPRADQAHKMAQYLNVSLEWLLTGKDESAIPAEFLVLLRNKTLLQFASRVEKANMRQTNALNAVLDAFEL